MLGDNALGMDAIGMTSQTAAVMTKVSADLPGSYRVLASVSADLPGSYSVLGAVSIDLPGAYVVRSQVSADLPGSYAVMSAVSRDLPGSYQIEAPVEYTRAPSGCRYYGRLPTGPDTLKRIGQVAPAVSLETARLGTRLDGDALDVEVMSFAAAFTEQAEHETQRCFIHQKLRATWGEFPAALQLRYSPLASVSAVKFFDESGVLRTLDPRDYVVDADSEPACLIPAAGRAWPQTMSRPGAVAVEYVSGYGPNEDSVPPAARMYVLAKLQQQYSPVANVKPENFDRLLDPLRVYL